MSVNRSRQGSGGYRRGWSLSPQHRCPVPGRISFCFFPLLGRRTDIMVILLDLWIGSVASGFRFVFLVAVRKVPMGRGGGVPHTPCWPGRPWRLAGLSQVACAWKSTGSPLFFPASKWAGGWSGESWAVGTIYERRETDRISYHLWSKIAGTAMFGTVRAIEYTAKARLQARRTKKLFSVRCVRASPGKQGQLEKGNIRQCTAIGWPEWSGAHNR